MSTQRTRFCLRRVRRVRGAAFTLVEIVTVMSLIAIFAGVLGFAFMRGGQSSVGLQAAQSTVSSLITLVRSQAAVSGRNAALFVNMNENNRDRYLRFLVPAVRDASNQWVPMSAGVLLPPGCYVVPFTAPSGSSTENGESWTNLNSSRLATTEPSLALMSATGEAWRGIEFTPRGTPTPAVGVGNQIVVAGGRPNVPGVSPPVVFRNPSNVRGILVSSTGLTRLVNDQPGFQ